MSSFAQIDLCVRNRAATIEFYRLLELADADALGWPAGSGA